MRRSDIIKSVNKIINALQKSKLHDAIQYNFRNDDKQETSMALIQALNKYSKLNDEFNKNENEIINILELQKLNDLKTWKLLLFSNKDDRENLRTLSFMLNRRIRFAIDILPKLLKLISQDGIENFSKPEKDRELKYQNKSILTVVLPEDEKYLSSPERLVLILESIQEFHKVFSEILNINDNELSVLAIDSGSDKSFDFLGGAKLMDSIKELILGLWDRVFFHKEKKTSEKLDLIAKSLPILDEINRLEQENKLGKERCELLRRGVFSGTEKFIKAGAILPEFEGNSKISPRSLMAPETKLLNENNDSSKKEKNTKKKKESKEELNIEDVSQEDLEKIRKIISKSNKKQKE